MWYSNCMFPSHVQSWICYARKFKSPVGFLVLPAQSATCHQTEPHFSSTFSCHEILMEGDTKRVCVWVCMCKTREGYSEGGGEKAGEERTWWSLLLQMEKKEACWITNEMLLTPSGVNYIQTLIYKVHNVDLEIQYISVDLVAWFSEVFQDSCSRSFKTLC